MNCSMQCWKTNLSFLFVLFGVVFLFSCSETEDDFSILDSSEFFPLEVGKFRTYQVDSIIFDPSSNEIIRDSSTTFFREEITDFFLDGEGNDVFRVERSTKGQLEEPWQFQLVYTMENTDEFAIQNENNLRLKVFPISIFENKEWVATNFFDDKVAFIIAGETIQVFKDWNSSIEVSMQMETIGDFEVETITILHQNDQSNVFERRLVREKYARGIGLVYREMQIFDSQFCNQEPVPDNCASIAWETKVEKGFSLKQTILEFN